MTSAKFRWWWGAFTVCLVLLACRNNANGNEAEEIVRADRGGDFRGVRIGDQREVVLKTETAQTVYNMPDELIYRAYPDGKDSTWYEITYNFNNQGLYDISLDVFPTTSSRMQTMKQNFVAYYKERYGECKQTNGFCTWRAMTDNGHIVDITLTDSLQVDERPRLRVNFNESQP